METYFVYSKSDQLQGDDTQNGQPDTSTVDPTNQPNSCYSVMYGMVQVIKKQTLANSLSVPHANKPKPKGLSLSFNSKQSALSNLLPLRGSSAHSTHNAIIGDYNQMKSHSSCKLQRIKSEKPSRKFTSRRKYMKKARLSDGFTELNTNGAGTHNLLDYARNQAQLNQLNQAQASTSSVDDERTSSNPYSSNEKMGEKKASLKLARNCRSAPIEEQAEDRRSSKKDKIDFL